MEGKFAFVMLLFGAVVVMGTSSQSDEDICDVQPGYRSDCGWVGIDQATCEERECCWDDSVEHSPYCYMSTNGAVPTCIIGPKARTECGWLGMDQETCESRGCCWDDSNPNEKYCYVKDFSLLPYGLCPVAPSERQECGYYGITKDECIYNNTCCWDDTVDNANWCFQQPSGEQEGCYIYHGISGSCNYVCEQDEDKAYGLCNNPNGRYCCYTGY